MKALLTSEAYHADPAIGSTFIKQAHGRSLLHALTADKKQTKAMALGSALHCATLEPERFKRTYMVAPSPSIEGLLTTVEDIKNHLAKIITDPAELKNKTKGTKPQLIANLRELDQQVPIWDELRAKFEIESAGKVVLEEKEVNAVIAMSDAITSHPVARHMLSGGEAEHSYFAPDLETGVMMKCRPDYVNRKARAIIDIKTTDDASYEAFSKTVGNMGIQIQGGHYLDVFNRAEELAAKKPWVPFTDFYIIAVENKFPYCVAIYKLVGQSLHRGHIASKQVFREYARFQKSGIKLSEMAALRYNFGYSSDIVSIEEPTWAINQLLEKVGA